MATASGNALFATEEKSVGNRIDRIITPCSYTSLSTSADTYSASHSRQNYRDVLTFK
jgi:hypothetical protein